MYDTDHYEEEDINLEQNINNKYSNNNIDYLCIKLTIFDYSRKNLINFFEIKNK